VELDVTERIVAAIAEQIGHRVGGNPVLNALEAEAHLQRLLGGRAPHGFSGEVGVRP
jgi:hypothetical protein